MTLPIKLPFLPMEARSVSEAPSGDCWQYEPKWDGFRCLAFRDGKDIRLQSKAGQPLGRYFPELERFFLDISAKKFVLDGEIVIPLQGRSSFDQLLLRVHPAKSRVQKLSTEFPAMFIAFDLLVDDKGKSHIQIPLEQRRRTLDGFAKRFFTDNEHIKLSPMTMDIRIATRWLRSRGNGLDGIVAKRTDLIYMSGTRDGMQKIKHKQTVD